MLKRLAEDDADVLGGVVLVDMEVALGLDGEVDEAVAGDLLEHVVEEADAGRDLGTAGAVEVDADRDVGLLGLALHVRATHRRSFGRAPFIRRAPKAPQKSLVEARPLRGATTEHRGAEGKAVVSG